MHDITWHHLTDREEEELHGDHGVVGRSELLPSLITHHSSLRRSHTEITEHTESGKGARSGSPRGARGSLGCRAKRVTAITAITASLITHHSSLERVHTEGTEHTESGKGARSGSPRGARGPRGCADREALRAKRSPPSLTSPHHSSLITPEISHREHRVEKGSHGEHGVGDSRNETSDVLSGQLASSPVGQQPLWFTSAATCRTGAALAQHGPVVPPRHKVQAHKPDKVSVSPSLHPAVEEARSDQRRVLQQSSRARRAFLPSPYVGDRGLDRANNRHRGK